MAQYTIFSQGDPFPHNEYYLEMLKHPALLGKVQTMSRLYLTHGEFETPKAAGEILSRSRKDRKGAWYVSVQVCENSICVR